MMMLRLLTLRLTVLSTVPSQDLDRAGNSEAYSRTRTTSCRVLGRASGGLKIKARVQESIKTDLKYLRPQISNLRRAAKPVNALRSAEGATLKASQQCCLQCPTTLERKVCSVFEYLPCSACSTQYSFSFWKQVHNFSRHCLFLHLLSIRRNQ